MRRKYIKKSDPEVYEFVALVPMGGKYEGEIGVHTLNCNSFKDAYDLANKKFIEGANPAIVKVRVTGRGWYKDLHVPIEKLWEIYTTALNNKTIDTLT